MHHCLEKINGIVVPPNQLLEHPNHLLQNPRYCSLNHKSKIHLMRHLLHYQIQSPSNASLLLANGHTIIYYFSKDLVIYEPLVLNTQQRVVTSFGGRCLMHLEFSLSSYNHLSFPLVSEQTLFNVC